MQDAVPYGSMPPEPDTVEMPETDEMVDEQPEQPPEAEKQPGESQVDYAKRYEELQKKFGEHSNVVGELRKQNQTLQQEMEAIRTASSQKEEIARNQPPPNDYEQMLRAVAKKAEDGDMTLEEALFESNRITREWSRAEAEQEKTSLLEQARGEVQQILSAKDAEKVVSKFHESNPDFVELQQSGQFEQMKAEDPLLDDLSAFWKAKALAAQTAAEKRFEEGKAEALRVASGSNRAGKVLADPGTSMQTQQKKTGPMSEQDIKSSMLSRLKE